MRIFVSGGAGFIGSHLCDRYVGEGHTVICFDNLMSGKINNIKQLLNYKNFKYINGDIRNYEQLEKHIKGCDVIFNMAALIHVDQSYIEPRVTYDINVVGTQNILELARLHDVSKVIHASSSEVYGTAQTVPMNEFHPLDAPHPYGSSKIASDRMCFSYAKTYGLNVIAPRMFNTFGIRQRSVGYGGVISIFVRRVLMGFPPIIFGSGKQLRDYTYVSDMVDAYTKILYSKEKLGVINFGSGKEICIQEIAETIIKLCDSKLEPTYIEPRISEVDRLICDSSKAEKLLGWKPKISFIDGLKMFIDDYKKLGLD